METATTVLAFWFGAQADDAETARTQSSLWWSKNEEVDAGIRRRFEATLQQAARGELNDWAATPHGRLALIVLTDQFPRNMYRALPQSFAFDAFAQAWCREGLRVGAHLALRPIERVFFYLPLEHAESLADQEQAVALFAELAAGAPAANKSMFDGYLDFAKRHRDIVARFGRFPHRNQILSRPSTAEELAFLQEKGSSF